MGRVSGKVAIVTGGAQGLGEGIATVLSREGATVVITDLNQAAGKATAQKLGAHFKHQDVTSEEGWVALLAEVEKEFATIDILVNNAGIGNTGRAQDPENTTLADWQRIHRVNSEGVFLGCKHVIPIMRRHGGGSIVNLSSIAALVPTPFITPYGAAKAGVLHLTRSVALYCAETKAGIRCNAIHPGQIRTPMHVELTQQIADREGIDVNLILGEFLKKIPMGEFGTAEDIGYAALYLAGDESKHVTGISLVVDGGMDLSQ